MSLKISRKTIIYLLYLLIWLPPESIQYGIPYMSLVFLVAQLGLGVFMLKKSPFRLSSRSKLFLSLFLLANIPGMINYGISIQRIVHMIVYAIGIMGMISFFQSMKKEEIQRFRTAISVLWIVSLLLTFFHYFTTELSDVYGSEVYFWGSRAITMQAFVALMGLSSCFDVLCENVISKKTFLLIGASVAFAIIRTSGQGISMVLTFCTLVFLNKIRKQKLWKVITPLAVVSIIVVLNYLIISLRFQDIDIIVRYITQVLSKDVSLTGRDQIFSGSLALFSQHPLIGYGYGNQIIYDVLGKIWKAFNTAHNSILQIMVDFGVIGTSLFGFFIFLFLRELKEKKTYYAEIIYFIIFAMFIGGLVNIIVPSEYFWIIISLGLGALANKNIEHIDM